MMMITPNCLGRQKEGVQGEGEDEEGDLRNGGQTRTTTPGTDAVINLLV